MNAGESIASDNFRAYVLRTCLIQSKQALRLFRKKDALEGLTGLNTRSNVPLVASLAPKRSESTPGGCSDDTVVDAGVGGAEEEDWCAD